MSQLDMSTGQIVANAAESERANFIKRTYVHLAGAIAAFAVIETLLIKSGVALSFMGMLSGSKWSWLIVLGAFMLVSTVANNWAHSGISREKQYMGLGLFVVAEAIIFMPLIYMALVRAPDGHLLQNAAVVTAALVAGLTFTAFSTKINFSFMGAFLDDRWFCCNGVNPGEHYVRLLIRTLVLRCNDSIRCCFCTLQHLKHHS